MPTKLATSQELPTQKVSPSDLYLDPRNPRIQELREDPSQEEILEILWRDFAVDELALSIAANGYLPYEPLFVVREHGHLTVVEGNRRLAAVKLLLDSKLRRSVGATDLPRLTKVARAQLDRLPVIEVRREQIWQYLGFKHVNGPQAWDSYSKASYIAWVHNELQISLDRIAEQIGDKHATVVRFYSGLMVLEQAEEMGVFQLEDRWKQHFSFSHLYTGLQYRGIQQFIGVAPRAVRKRPVPSKRKANLGDLMLWLFGSKSRSQPPVVQTQNPDLRILDEVLQSRDGTAALRRGIPLSISRELIKGDEFLFRAALLDAKRAIQEARGKLITGFNGEKDLLETAADIAQIASSVEEEMRQVVAKSRAASRSTRSRGQVKKKAAVPR